MIKDRKVIESPSEKEKETLETWVKRQGRYFHMYTNKPRSKDRAYNQKNQSFKTGNNASI